MSLPLYDKMKMPGKVGESTVQPEVHALFEMTTQTWQYICVCPTSQHAVIIDPILDLKPSDNGISTVAADNIMRIVRHYGYTIDRLLETHSHPSHLSAAWYLRTQLRLMGQEPRIAVGKSMDGLRRLFARKYQMDDPGWTGAFDGGFSDGDSFQFGELNVKVLHLPGHLPDQVGFVIGSNIFAGDALESTHHAHQRSDDASDTNAVQQASIQRLLQFAPNYRIFKGHEAIRRSPRASKADESVRLVPYATVEEHRFTRRSNSEYRPRTLESAVLSRSVSRASQNRPLRPAELYCEHCGSLWTPSNRAQMV